MPPQSVFAHSSPSGTDRDVALTSEADPIHSHNKISRYAENHARGVWDNGRISSTSCCDLQLQIEKPTKSIVPCTATERTPEFTGALRAAVNHPF